VPVPASQKAYLLKKRKPELYAKAKEVKEKYNLKWADALAIVKGLKPPPTQELKKLEIQIAELKKEKERLEDEIRRLETKKLSLENKVGKFEKDLERLEAKFRKVEWKIDALDLEENII
jgi:chromosome segregation ATPase